jgi:hypothetical protein
MPREAGLVAKAISSGTSAARHVGSSVHARDTYKGTVNESARLIGDTGYEHTDLAVGDLTPKLLYCRCMLEACPASAALPRSRSGQHPARQGSRPHSHPPHPIARRHFAASAQARPATARVRSLATLACIQPVLYYSPEQAVEDLPGRGCHARLGNQGRIRALNRSSMPAARASPRSRHGSSLPSRSPETRSEPRFKTQLSC